MTLIAVDNFTLDIVHNSNGTLCRRVTRQVRPHRLGPRAVESPVPRHAYTRSDSVGGGYSKAWRDLLQCFDSLLYGGHLRPNLSRPARPGALCGTNLGSNCSGRGTCRPRRTGRAAGAKAPALPPRVPSPAAALRTASPIWFSWQHCDPARIPDVSTRTVTHVE